MAKINIKTKIRLGFIAVFLIMTIISAYLIFQITTITKNTTLIFEHPFKVSNTIRDVKIEIYKTTHLVRDIKYLENDQQLNNLINVVKKEDSTINVDFKIIKELYLGNKKDVEDLIKSYQDLSPIRQKLYQFKRENNIDSLDYTLQYKNNLQIDKIIYFSDKISSFAKNKGTETYFDTKKTEKRSLQLSLIILIIVSVFVVVFSFYISRIIAQPVQTFIQDANKILSSQLDNTSKKIQHDDEVFGLTLGELRTAYQNIEQQKEEIQSFNEHLLNLNESLEKKVKERTLELEIINEQLKKENIERKQVEDALFETTNRLELSLKAAVAGTWDWNVASGEIVWSKPMFELLGLDPINDDASFDTWRAKLHPDDIEMAEFRITDALEKHINLQSDYRVVLPDGNIKWINATGEGFYDAAGQALRMIGICQDITERKQSEEKIKIQLNELNRWNNVMLARENRIIELKAEVNDLLRNSGDSIRYPSQKDKLTNNKSDENIDATKG